MVKDLEIAVAALDALGIPHGPAGTIRSFYPNAAREYLTAVDLRIGYPEWRYALGLVKDPATGSYSLVGDNFDLAGEYAPTISTVRADGLVNCKRGLAGSEMLLKLGPSMLDYDCRTVNGINGHWMTGTPTHFLREYACQTGIALARQYGMSCERLAGDCPAYHGPGVQNACAQAQAGAEKLLLTGGYLPPGMTMIVLANPDGTVAIAFDGATGSECYAFTKPLEDALGATLADVSTLETHHQWTGQAHHHVARS
jgi:hypothetical protein